jgi:hypothetical protein
VSAGRALLGGALLAGFQRRVVVLGPRDRRAYRPADWRDAIVLVDHGQIQLEFAGQPPRRFGRGALLCLGGLGLSAIYNHGPQPAVLIAVWRRPAPKQPPKQR